MTGEGLTETQPIDISKVSQVKEEINRLNEIIQVIKEEIILLYTRLQPIILDIPVEVVGEGKPVLRVPLAMELYSMKIALCKVLRDIRDLRGSIEL